MSNEDWENISVVRKRGLERGEGRKKRMECLFQMGSYYVVLVGPEHTRVNQEASSL